MNIQKRLKDQKYIKSYSETNLFSKIAKFAKAAGIKIIYASLILYYTLQKSSTPVWAKSMIIGALGYFIFPIDFIPDFIPFVGYADDFSALAGVLVAVALFVDEDVKKKSKEKLHIWFGNIDNAELKSVDNKIKNSD
jgi:uncharacterized membrane protein YkvA (DUF1232 family)